MMHPRLKARFQVHRLKPPLSQSCRASLSLFKNPSRQNLPPNRCRLCVTQFPCLYGSPPLSSGPWRVLQLFRLWVWVLSGFIRIMIGCRPPGRIGSLR